MNMSGTRGGVLFLLSLILIAPAAATISLQNVQVIPPEDLVPAGTVVNTTAYIQIIPQGPTTFIEGYTLVLSTDLENARWDTAVMVDGARAAVIPKDGKFVFINGYLLSYPTNRDVAVSVAVQGTVPFLPDKTPFRVVQAEELNNQGQAIGDSEQVVVRSVMATGDEPGVTRTAAEATVIVTVPVQVTPTQAGLSLIPLAGGIILAVLLFLRKGR